MNRCVTVLRRPLVGVTILLGNAFFCDHVHAQSGLRASLERLDTNENGLIEPDEITPLARPYLEQLAKTRSRDVGLSLDRPTPIDRIQAAARIYHAFQNGVNGSQNVRPEGESTVLPFGAEPDQPLVPQFGLPEVKYPYVQADLEEADRTLRRSDRNGDGHIDRAEAAVAKWTHRNPFDDDLNKDDRLSRMELGQRYARRRLLAGDSEELVRKAWRTGGEIRPSVKEQRRRDDSHWWRKGGSSHWLTASVLGRFDLNKNGRLEFEEAQSLGIPVGRIDVDRDGELSREELHAHMSALQDEAGDLSEGLPGWFYELDVDRDGQVDFSEFAPGRRNEKRQEFASLDRNRDGLLTASEIVQSKAMIGGSYRNDNAEVLPPYKTIISEIEVNEDFLIGDLNVQISITHSNTGFLDAFLTGPDGQRIELFTDVGGGGDNFDETYFDDQSPIPITKAKAPFKGAFLPEALLKRQPSLSHFNGKSANGVWQLVIRGTRSERFGMLHGWGLIIRPQENMLDATVAVPSQDGPPPSATTPSWPSQGRQADDPRVGAAGQPPTQTRRSPRPGFARPETAGREESGAAERQSKIEAQNEKIAKYKEWLKSKGLPEDTKFPGKKFPSKKMPGKEFPGKR